MIVIKEIGIGILQKRIDLHPGWAIFLITSNLICTVSFRQQSTDNSANDDHNNSQFILSRAHSFSFAFCQRSQKSFFAVKQKESFI